MISYLPSRMMKSFGNGAYTCQLLENLMGGGGGVVSVKMNDHFQCIFLSTATHTESHDSLYGNDVRKF